jgi:hypothetical protein
MFDPVLTEGRDDENVRGSSRLSTRWGVNFGDSAIRRFLCIAQGSAWDVGSSQVARLFGPP